MLGETLSLSPPTLKNRGPNNRQLVKLILTGLDRLLCLMLCASRSNVRTLKKFAFVDGATVYLTRTNDEAAQQERRRLDSHVCRISTGTDGKQTGGAFVGRGQELVFTPKTTAPGHGRERVFTQAKQVLFSHVGPRPVTKTQEAAQSPL